MKYVNEVVYNVKTNFDKSGIVQFQQALNNLERELVKRGGTALYSDKQLIKDKNNIDAVRKALLTAYNPTTGLTSITKFNKSLAGTGTSLNSIATSFNGLGASGKLAFTQLLGQLGTYQKGIRQTTTLTEKLGTTLGNTVRWGLVAGAFQEVMSSASQAVEYVKELDESLTQITMVSGESRDNMKEFAEYANKAAAALGSSTTDYTNATKIFIQEGFSLEESKTQATQATVLGNVSEQDTSTTADQITAYRNAFGLSVDEMNTSLDKIASLANNTASNVSELMTASQRAGSTAASVGASEDTFLASIATIQSITRESAEQIGNGLKSIYTRFADIKMGDDTDDGVSLGQYSSTLKAAGVNILDSNGEYKGMDQIMSELQDVWATLSETQKVAVGEKVAGRYQYNRFAALMNNQSYYDKSMDAIENSDGMMDQMQDAYMEGMEGQLQKISTNMETLFTSIYNSGLVEDVVGAFANLSDVLSDLFDNIDGGVPIIAGLVTIVGKLAGKQIATGVANMMMNAEARKDETNSRAFRANQLKAAVGNATTAGQKTFIDLSSKAARYETIMTAEEKEKLTQAETEYIAALKEEISNQGRLEETIASLNWKEGSQIAIQQQLANLNKEDASTLDRYSAMINILNEALSGIDNKTTDVVEAMEALQKMENESSTTTENLIEGWEKLRKELQRGGASTKEVTEIIEALNKANNDEMSAAELSTKIHKEYGETLGIVYQQTLDVAAADKNVAPEVQKLANETAKLGNDISKTSAKLTIAEMELAAFSNETMMMRARIQSTMAIFSGFGMGLMNISMIASSVSEAFKTLGDDSATTGEKISALVSAFAMVGITVGMMAPSLKTATTLFKENKLVTEEGTAANGLYTLGMKILGKEEKKEGAAAAEAGIGHEVQAAGEIDAAEGAVILEGALLPVLAATAAIAAALAVAAGVILAAKIAFDKFYSSLHASSQAYADQKEALDTLSDGYESVKSSYDDLTGSLSDIEDSRDSIDNMIKGTQEWKEAVQELNLEVLELVTQYPELAKGLTTNSNGILTLSGDVVDDYVDEQLEKVNVAANAQYVATLNTQVAKSNSDIEDFVYDYSWLDEAAYNGDYTAARAAVDTVQDTLKNVDLNSADAEEQIKTALKDAGIIDSVDNLSSGEEDLVVKAEELAGELQANTDALNQVTSLTTSRGSFDGFSSSQISKMGEDKTEDVLGDIAGSGRGLTFYDDSKFLESTDFNAFAESLHDGTVTKVDENGFDGGITITYDDGEEVSYGTEQALKDGMNAYFGSEEATKEAEEISKKIISTFGTGLEESLEEIDYGSIEADSSSDPGRKYKYVNNDGIVDTEAILDEVNNMGLESAEDVMAAYEEILNQMSDYAQDHPLIVDIGYNEEEYSQLLEDLGVEHETAYNSLMSDKFGFTGKLEAYDEQIENALSEDQITAWTDANGEFVSGTGNDEELEAALKGRGYTVNSEDWYGDYATDSSGNTYSGEKIISGKTKEDLQEEQAALEEYKNTVFQEATEIQYGFDEMSQAVEDYGSTIENLDSYSLVEQSNAIGAYQEALSEMSGLSEDAFSTEWIEQYSDTISSAASGDISAIKELDKAFADLALTESGLFDDNFDNVSENIHNIIDSVGSTIGEITDDTVLGEMESMLGSKSKLSVEQKAAYQEALRSAGIVTNTEYQVTRGEGNDKEFLNSSGEWIKASDENFNELDTHFSSYEEAQSAVNKAITAAQTDKITNAISVAAGRITTAILTDEDSGAGYWYYNGEKYDSYNKYYAAVIEKEGEGATVSEDDTYGSGKYQGYVSMTNEDGTMNAWGQEYLENKDAEATINTLEQELTAYNAGTNQTSGTSSDSGSSSDSSDTVEADVEKNIDLYEEVNEQLERISASYDKINSYADRLYGNDRINQLQKTIDKEKEYVDVLESKLRIQQLELDTLLNSDVDINDNSTIGSYLGSDAFNADGSIDYDAYYNKYMELYNAAMAYDGSSDEDGYDTAVDALEDFEEAVEAYYEALNNRDSLIQELDDSIYKIQDQNKAIIDELETTQEDLQSLNDTMNSVQDVKDWFANGGVGKIWTTDLKAAMSDLNLFMTEENTDLYGNETTGRLQLAENNLQYWEEQQSIYDEVIKPLSEAYQTLSQDVNTPTEESLAAYNAYLDALENTEGYAGLEEADLTEELKSARENDAQAWQDLQSGLDEAFSQYTEMLETINDQFDRIIDDMDDIKDDLNTSIDITKMLYGDDSYEQQNVLLSQTKDVLYEKSDAIAQQIEYQKTVIQDAADKYGTDSTAYQDALDRMEELEDDQVDNMKEILETTQKIYENMVNADVSDWSSSILGVGDLDWYEDEWDMMTRNAEQYYDEVNRAYEIQKLQGEYLDTLNNASGLDIQKQISDQMAQQLDYLRTKTNLSEYDVKYAQAQLEILQKQIALQDAQSNKSKMKLKRDSQGNYSYVYTADEDAVSSAESDLEEAQNNAYNLSKDALVNAQESAIDAVKDAKSKLVEVMTDASLTQEQQAERIQYISDSLKEYLSGISEDIGTISNNIMEDVINMAGSLLAENSENLQNIVADLVAGNTDAWDQIDERLNNSVTNALQQYENIEEQTDELTDTLTDLAYGYGDDLDAALSTVDSTMESYVDDVLNEARDATVELTDTTNEFFDVLDTRASEAFNASSMVSAYTKSLEALNSQYQAEIKQLQDQIDAETNASSSSSSASGSAGSTGSLGADTIDGIAGNVWVYGGWGVGSARQQAVDAKFGSGTWQNIIQPYINKGMESLQHDWTTGYYKNFFPSNFLSGGYTGTWGDIGLDSNHGKMAILHQKELVLNAADTENLLETVKTLNSMNLDSLNNLALNADKVGTTAADTIEQRVQIDATFPAAESAAEIKQALLSLADNAYQVANRNY